MNTKDQAPTPLETTPGQQMDDNIDDLGRKKDGTSLDQPGGAEAPPKEKASPKPK
jgi:hypothetical protein